MFPADHKGLVFAEVYRPKGAQRMGGMLGFSEQRTGWLEAAWRWSGGLSVALAISALSNFVLLVAVSRTAGSAEFSRFNLSFLLAQGVIVGTARASLGELAILSRGRGRLSLRLAFLVTMGSLSTWLVAGTFMYALGGIPLRILVPLGLGACVGVLGEHQRGLHLFARNSVRLVSAEFGWLLVVVVGLWLRVSLEELAVLWAAGAGVWYCILLGGLRERSARTSALSPKAMRDLGGDYLLSISGGVAAEALLVSVAGWALAGVYQELAIAYRPLSVVNGVVVVLVLQSGNRRLLALSRGAVIVGAMFVTGVGIVWPEMFRLLGAEGASPQALPVLFVGMGAATAGALAVRSADLKRRGLTSVPVKARLFSSPVSIGAPAAGSAWGLPGICLGALVGRLGSYIASWWLAPRPSVEHTPPCGGV